MADFKPKPREKNILDSKRISLSVPCPVKGIRAFSNLHYYANNDNPGITVYTGVPEDKDNNFGRIQCKFGILDLMTHIKQLEATIRSPEPVKYTAFCQSPRGQDKKQMDVSSVEVGKRPDGVVYIMVEDLEKQNRPKIYFPFAPSRWHHFAKNGVPLTEAELSILIAGAVVDLLKELVPLVAKDTYKHPEPKQQNGNGGGGGGNYNRGNGGGGNYNRGGNGGGGNYGGGNDSDDSGGGYGGGKPAGGFDGGDDDVPF